MIPFYCRTGLCGSYVAVMWQLCGSYVAAILTPSLGQSHNLPCSHRCPHSSKMASADLALLPGGWEEKINKELKIQIRKAAATTESPAARQNQYETQTVLVAQQDHQCLLCETVVTNV